MCETLHSGIFSHWPDKKRRTHAGYSQLFVVKWGLPKRGYRHRIAGWQRQQEMVHDMTTGVLALFLMSPREVLVIVLITAVIVYIAARKRRS